MAGISCAFCLMRIGHRFLAEWLPMPALWVIAAGLLLTDYMPFLSETPQGNECIFEFNSPDRRWYGIYKLSNGNKEIAVVWHYPVNVHDTLTGEISKDGISSSLSINGKNGKDSLQVNLVKKR